MMRRQGTPPTTAKVEAGWPEAPKLSQAKDQDAINDYHEQMKTVMQRKLESVAKAIPVATTQNSG